MTWNSNWLQNAWTANFIGEMEKGLSRIDEYIYFKLSVSIGY